MIRVMLVDDEQAARERLRQLLAPIIERDTAQGMTVVSLRLPRTAPQAAEARAQ
jgi:DNA-binding LytR/AlgR family response regulator